MAEAIVLLVISGKYAHDAENKLNLREFHLSS